MEAAVAGGVTSLACPPDTDPPLDEPGLVEMLKHRARSLNQAHVYPVGALTVGLQGRDAHRDGRARRGRLRRVLAGRRAARRHAGAAARDAVRGDVRLPRLAAPAGRASRAGRRRARRRGRDAAGPAGDSGRRPRPSRWRRSSRWCATPARACTCAGCRRAEGVAMVRAAKRDGLPVTCDVAVHHLHLCDIDIGWFDAQCRLVPPLRGTRDRDALRAGLADGTIDAVCSDHTPVDDDAQAGAVRRSRAGRDRPRAAAAADAQMGGGGPRFRCRTRSPASRRSRRPSSASTPGISAAGAGRCLHLRSGPALAVEPAALQSQGKNTPFLGLELPRQGACTLVAGQVVYEADRRNAPGTSTTAVALAQSRCRTAGNRAGPPYRALRPCFSSALVRSDRTRRSAAC